MRIHEPEEVVVVSSVLDQGGSHVMTTADGPHGVELYRDHHANLVLLDLGLPTFEEKTVLATIREKDPKAKVIIVSGDLSHRTTSETMKLGALEILTRPFTPHTLLEKVRIALAS